MKVILYILLLVVAVFVGMFVHVGYRILTGKTTKEEVDKMVQQEKERKAKKRKPSGSAHWLSYPSPLNRWGLWN